MIKFTIPGEVIPQLRPRFVRAGNHVRTYDLEKCVNYKAYVRMIATEFKPETPIEGAVSVGISIYRQPPKSFSKKKLEQALRGELYPVSKPDVDNLAKGILDALKGLVWKDDAQIVNLLVIKEFSPHPCVEIEIQEIKNKGILTAMTKMLEKYKILEEKTNENE